MPDKLNIYTETRYIFIYNMLLFAYTYYVNMLKMQIPFISVCVYLVLCKVCLATIGVCVYCADFG